MIRAITFDLWDTLVVDDSDELTRSREGLRTKVEERHALFGAWAARHGVSAADAREALEGASARFRHAWKVEHRTPHIGDRLLDAAHGLGLDADDAFEHLVEAFCRMEVDVPPVVAPHARETLEALHGRYRLGIVSDAIVTPGASLRRMLAGHDLLRFFDVTVFSDEAGAAKPARHVFDLAARELGVSLSELAHVGDREANDVAGPLAVGAFAVLYTGVVDRGAEHTRAHAVCSHHDQLPAILATLGGPA